MNVQTPSELEPSKPKALLPEPPKKEQRSSSHIWLWLLIIAAAAAAVYYFYWLPRQKPAQSTDAPAGKGGKKGGGAIPVVAAKVTKGNIGVYYTGLGVVTPIYTVTIKSRVDGQLIKINYKEGELVKQGDLLLEIDPRPFEVQLEQAEGQRAKDQASLDNARIDLARYQKLWSQNAIPQQQLATQEALVTQDEGTVKSDQGQIDSAKLNLTYAKIVSPITGRIGLRLVDPGNIVHASDSNGLLVITQIQPISVIFTIAEDQVQPVIKRMRAGQKLRVEAWDRELSHLITVGVLSTFDNQIDQTTGTLKLRATFDNPADALFPNQFVNARLLVEEKSGVALVPNAAVQRNSQATYVYVVKPNNTVTVRPVTLGTTEGELTQIMTGLTADEVVVTDGVDKLQEGGRVTPKVAGAGAGSGGAKSKKAS